ncbi:MAG TPA: hypothetical protein VGG03_13540 [Thermoanaerobaculia bacterium]
MDLDLDPLGNLDDQALDGRMLAVDRKAKHFDLAVLDRRLQIKLISHWRLLS